MRKASSSDNSTILIGTCRIKRPIRYFNQAARARTHRIRSHVHYPREILQLINYLREDIHLPNAVLPFILEDLDNSHIESVDALEEHRGNMRQALDEASQVIVEVSSLKKILIKSECGIDYFANITSCARIRNNQYTHPLLDINDSTNPFYEPSTSISSSEEFISDLQSLIDALAPKKIVLVPHFRAIHPNTGQPIPERIKINQHLKSVAKSNGCDILDPNVLIDKLGPTIALKDSSHYTEAAEVAMSLELVSRIMTNQESAVH